MKILSIILLFILIFLTVFIVFEKPKTPKDRTYEVMFQIIGKPLKTSDRLITRFFNINNNDEKILGEEIRKKYYSNMKSSQKTQDYLQTLINKMATYHNPKNLKWTIFIYEGEPNAYALPGGIIAISSQMLKLLTTEAELVAILAHEKAHIDLNHCIDKYRVEAKKNSWSILKLPLKIISSIHNMFLRHSYGKYEENEADQYAFETLIAMDYNPLALSSSFNKLLKIDNLEDLKKNKSIIADYFQSHPSLNMRADQWEKLAKQYMEMNHKQTYDEIFINNFIDE
jgi:predicted Zn-dependent protease